jgi:O-antigen/teichoic acid export membrane protein
LLLSFIFIPLYIKILGSESYGLIAFFATLVGSLSILDMGLSTAISRQVSVLNADRSNIKIIGDLVFSVEIIYWVISLLIGICIIFFSENIALHWLKSNSLEITKIRNSIIIMGAIFAFSFPISLYSGVLNSLGLQLQCAGFTLLSTILKSIGVLIVLDYYHPTIENYFIWHFLISLVLVLVLKKSVGAKIFLQSPNFSRKQLGSIWKFSAGMAGISFITFFLSQIDKIMVSKFLALDVVGYYGLAFTLGFAITQVITPFQPIIFPKFSTLVSLNKHEELVDLYHKYSRWITLIIGPIGFGMILFSSEILMFWTKNTVLTENTAPILRILTAGTLFNCLMWVPYWYLLAKGITKFTFYQNLIAAVILIPLLYYWIINYGAIGASLVWFTVNLGYVIISIPIFHKLYMKKELMKWYIEDTLKPLITSFIVLILMKFIQISYFENMDLFTFIILYIFSILVYIIIIPETRRITVKLLA